jgi:multiple sugar transport system permease protein
MAGALLGSLPLAFVYSSFACSFFVEHDVSGMTGSVKE